MHYNGGRIFVGDNQRNLWERSQREYFSTPMVRCQGMLCVEYYNLPIENNARLFYNDDRCY